MKLNNLKPIKTVILAGILVLSTNLSYSSAEEDPIIIDEPCIEEEIAEITTEEVTEPATVKTMYTQVNLHYRTAPILSDTNIKGTLKRGSKLLVTKNNSEWSNIFYNNTIYYVSSKYIAEVPPKQIPDGVLFEGVFKERADRIAIVCAENYEKYGILPSVCIAQAMQETTLGKAYNNGNLWGIKSGRVSYSSIEDGTIAYLKVINNGYYPNAPFEKVPYKQISAIIAGGYCENAGDYVSKVVKIINDYHLYEYDKMVL